MPGPRSGPRWIPPNLNDPAQLLGARVRELRVNADMTLRDLAAAMSWSVEKTERVQRGEASVTAVEAWELASLFNVAVDDLLCVMSERTFTEPADEPPDDDRVLTDIAVRYVAELAPFKAWAGQTEDIERLARRVGVSRAEMCRRLWDVGIHAYREHLGQKGQS